MSERSNWSMYAFLRSEYGKKFPATKKMRTICMEYARENKESVCLSDIEWTLFRPYSEEWCNYDSVTKKCTLPYRLTDDEKREFEESYWIHFHDPYCDGRDCTGAPFTSWMRFFRCSDRTIVLHRINFDV